MVIYVGQTSRPKERFYQHCNNGISEISYKCKDLIKNGFKPIFTIVHETNDKDYLKLERNLICKMLDEGMPLLNKITEKEMKRKYLNK